MLFELIIFVIILICIAVIVLPLLAIMISIPVAAIGLIIGTIIACYNSIKIYINKMRSRQ